MESVNSAWYGSSIGVAAVDEDLRVRWVNAVARDLLGLRDPLGETDDHLPLPAAEAFRNSAGSGQAELVAVSKAGEKHRRLCVVAGPLERGLRLFWLVDVTAASNREGSRRSARQLTTLDGLLSRTSHELRNKLASVMVGLQALQKGEGLSRQDAPLVDLILDETRAALRVIEALRNVTGPPLETVSLLEIEPLLMSSLLAPQDPCARKGVSLDLLSGEVGLWVYGDPKALAASIGRLVQNSLDACDSGDGITVGWRRVEEAEARSAFPGFEGPVAGIFFHDTGKGLAESSCGANIFDPFITWRSAAPGLGLSVARRIVECHGGVIELQRTGSRGTRFEIFLPAGGAEDQAEFSNSTASSQGATGIPCRTCDIPSGANVEFCWDLRRRVDKPLVGLWADICHACSFFHSSNLVPFFGNRGDG